MQAVALAAAHGPALSQRVPLGLAEVGVAVELFGDLAGDLYALWYGFCVAGAAELILAACAGPEEYLPMWENA